MDDLSSKTVIQLRTLAKKLGVSGYSKLKKVDLVTAIEDHVSKSSKKTKITIRTKKKVSPKKKSSPKKKGITIKRTSSKKNVDVDEDTPYGNLRIIDLISECKKRGMAPIAGGCKKGTRKAELIKLLIDDDSSRGKGKKTQKKGNVDSLLCDDNGKRKCDDDKICDAFSGKCVRKTKAGRPWGESVYERAYGSDYNYDDDLGIIGSKDAIKKHKLVLGKKKSVVKKKSKSPKVVKAKGKKAKRCDDPVDYVDCSSNQVCNANTGKCRKDTKTARKGQYELSVMGRTIVGRKEAILKLQETLGGIIRSADSPKEPKGKEKMTEQEEIEIEEIEHEDEEKAKKLEKEMEKKKEKERRDALKLEEERKEKYERELAEKAKKKEIEDIEDEGDDTEVDEEPVVVKPKVKGKRGRRQKQIGKEDLTKIEEEKRPSSKVDIARQEVYDSFRRCIESIN